MVMGEEVGMGEGGGMVEGGRGRRQLVLLFGRA